jgi:hypothetical protein
MKTYLSHLPTGYVAECTQDTQCTPRLVYQIIMEHTHDKYCDMILNPGDDNSRHSTDAWEYTLHYLGRHPDTNVF